MITVEDTKNVWVTADHHFGHENIIRFCERPYNSIEKMDEDLIAKWNDVVGDGDTVYHLGDFTLGDDLWKYLDRLKGTVYFVSTPYHHDKRWMFFNRKTVSLSESHRLDINLGSAHPFSIHMFHYPIEDWEKKYHGSIHLHGHSHGKASKIARRIDVGVDCWNYRPVNLHQILQMEGVV